MSKNWQRFWSNYRNEVVMSEDDLFIQAAQTINRLPIPKDMFDMMVTEIIRALNLQNNDHLVDICCGNGLLSYELAPHVSRITAVDFVPRMIANAKRFKTRANITYKIGAATDPFPTLFDSGTKPNKFLMNDSLAYFEPAELGRMLGNAIEYMRGQQFAFLLTGIPNDALKWDFYDTPERKARYVESEKSPDTTHDGLGRWWHASEIEMICQTCGLRVEISDQPLFISNYRMNALITQK